MECEAADCKHQPIYNEEGKNAAFCSEHAEDYMVNVLNKRCEHESCKKYAIYNHPEGKGVLFCKQHAEDGMVTKRHCKHPGCTTCSSRGYWADGIVSRCTKHESDLTEEGGLVINYDQRCRVAGVKGCGGRVNWGPAGEHPTHCHKHGAPKAAAGFVCIPKKSNKGGQGAASRPRRGAGGGGGGGSGSGSGGGGAAKKARKARPRRDDTSSEEESESESESESEEKDDDEFEGEDDEELEPAPKRRVIWL